MSNRPFNKSKSQVVTEKVQELKDLETQNCNCDCNALAGKLYTRIDDLEKERIEPTKEEVKEIKTNYQIMKDEIIRLHRSSFFFGLVEILVLVMMGIAIFKLNN